MCLEKKLDMYLMKIQISFAQKKKIRSKNTDQFCLEEKKKKSFDVHQQILKFKKKNYNRQLSKDHAKKILVNYLSMAIIY